MEHALVMPKSKLYIRGFVSFIHAFKHWHQWPEANQLEWFIVDESYFPLGFWPDDEWIEFDEPCPWPKNWRRQVWATRTNRGKWKRNCWATVLK